MEEDKWNHRNTLQIIVEFGYYTFSSGGFSAFVSHSLVNLSESVELPTGCCSRGPGEDNVNECATEK